MVSGYWTTGYVFMIFSTADNSIILSYKRARMICVDDGPGSILKVRNKFSCNFRNVLVLPVWHKMLLGLWISLNLPQTCGFINVPYFWNIDTTRLITVLATLRPHHYFCDKPSAPPCTLPAPTLPLLNSFLYLHFALFNFYVHYFNERKWKKNNLHIQVHLCYIIKHYKI